MTSKKSAFHPLLLLLACAVLGIATGRSTGCAGSSEPAPVSGEVLNDTTLAHHASIGPFQAQGALVITDNDEALASKLRMIDGANSSIDMLYFVYWDDYSSAVFSEALLRAVGRGVAVRLLIDYDTNYKDLDFFSMLEREAGAGPGSLEVRFYNRPTRQIVRDAAFMTMGCTPAEESGEEGDEPCDERKFEAIDRAFAGEGTAPGKNLSNLNLAHSGLLLSGWYTRDPEVMALAVVGGQGIDLGALSGSDGDGDGAGLESVKKLATIYWRSKNGPFFQRVANKLKLTAAYLLHRGEINQLRETVSSLLPLRAQEETRDWRDWEYLMDFLHQKLLLVDGEKVQLGGRNVGDPYHMRPNPLLGEHYYFSDTDVYFEIGESEGDAFRGVYERLWGFDRMVATTADVRSHAPNDYVANGEALDAAGEACAEESADARLACVDREFASRARSVEERVAERGAAMRRKAAEYRDVYAGAPPLGIDAPTFEIDAGARVAYLENLPFVKELPTEKRARQFGATGLGEADDGKYIHHLWRLGLENACDTATAESPRRVILHHAYYLPPANLLRTAGEMASGERDCGHVMVQVLTNSAATTDFHLLNPLAHHGLKAFSDFLAETRGAASAGFEFYEYLPNPAVPKFSLHSKVVLFGDDVLIGSANADVRSYMMDSNNSVWIRGAPRFGERYTEMMDALLSDPEVATDLGEYLRSTSREALKAEHLEQFRKLFGARLGGLSEENRATAEGLYGKLLDSVYEQTAAVLRGDEEALEGYNRLLKLL